MPIRMKVHFGDTIPEDQRKTDRDEIALYTARLSRVTGLPVLLTDRNPNYHVFIVNEDERRQIGPELRALVTLTLFCLLSEF